MVAGEVRGCFFQELVFHLQFPGFPFELAQPRALIHGQRRLFTGMLTAVGAHPVTEGSFVDTELLCHSGDRARRLDHHLHGFILEFRREALLRSEQLLHLSRRPSYWMDCPEASGHLTRGWCRLTGLTPLYLWLACLLTIRNQRILAAWDARQADNARRAAAGLPPRTRKRRRRTLASRAAAPP